MFKMLAMTFDLTLTFQTVWWPMLRSPVNPVKYVFYQMAFYNLYMFKMFTLHVDLTLTFQTVMTNVEISWKGHGKN